jgi:hypothetical protein
VRTTPAGRLGLAALLLLGGGCNKDAESVWVEFNAPNQTLSVEVLPAGSPMGDDLTLELLSNLGRTVVGEALVSPGSAPVGTSHLVAVDVLDDFEELVGRVTVIVDTQAIKDLDGDGEPDSRGEGEFELRRDSADPGAWALTLQSLGGEDERRTDRLTIVLWQEEELSTVETEE